MKKVRVYRHVIQAMIAHARREAPLECCGLLSGAGQVIDALRAASNERRSSKEFSVPAQELFIFFKDLRRTGRQHLGVYHSHPASRARPSRQDVAEFHYPNISYWIVSLENPDPEVRCFLWYQADFREASVGILGP